MRKVKIITDSCSDLTPELLERYGIDYAKMNTVLNGETSPARLEWTPDEVHAFYDLMRAGKRITTTQVPVEEFKRIFEKYLSEDYDIVYVACCSKQSGSVNTARVVAEKMLPDYPGAAIYVIDALNSAMGEGLLSVVAAMFVQDGLSADEVAERVTAMRKNVNEYITVHSLDALARSGRLKASKAFIGNLMGVKPILTADYYGAQTPMKKVRGRQNSLRKIVTLLKDAIDADGKYPIFFCHADCRQDEVDEILAMIREEIPGHEICVGCFGPIIGASIGPDAVGVFGIGKEVTFGKEATEN
ncbi:MAG: DegV family protein [Clostridia bacterium]|nr:DegV family protein [Clostridia bacterium]